MKSMFLNKLKVTSAITALAIVASVSGLLPLQHIARADEATTATAAASTATATATATATLKAIYAQRDMLLKNKQLDAYIAYESPSFTLVDSDGEATNKAESDADFKKSFHEMPDFDSITTTIDRVTEDAQGTTAEVTTVFATSIRSADGKLHKVEATANFVDVWVKNTSVKAGVPVLLLAKSTATGTTGIADGQEIPVD